MNVWHGLICFIVDPFNATANLLQSKETLKVSSSHSMYLQLRNVIHELSGFCGLGVACWPLVPKFVGSNPAEPIGFLRAKKSSARLPSEGN